MDTSLVNTGGETETTNVSELVEDNEYALSKGIYHFHAQQKCWIRTQRRTLPECPTSSRSSKLFLINLKSEDFDEAGGRFMNWSLFISFALNWKKKRKFSLSLTLS